jgi:hypothetical protein
MIRRVVAGVFLLANVAGPAWADACGTASHGSNMTNTQIMTLLNPGTGIYACYNNGTRRESNETLLAGTQFQEYHKGGSTVEIEGAYAISESSLNHGLLTYTYNSGGVYSYRVCTDASAAPTYYFVANAGPGLTAGQVLNIVVSTSPANAC